MIAAGKQRFSQARARLKGPAWVTPESFNVAPELLHLQLAKPGRRAIAIAIDLLLIAILSGANNIWLVAALVLVGWHLFRKKQAATTSRQRKWVVWGLCAVFLWLSVQHGKDFWEDRQDDSDRPPATSSAAAKAKRDREAAKRTQAAALALKKELAQRDASKDDGRSKEERDKALNEAIAAVVSAATSAKRPGSAPLAATPPSAPVTASPPEPGAVAASSPPADMGAERSPEAPAATAEPTDAERIAQLEQELEEARKPKEFRWKAEAKRWLDGLGVSFGWAVVYFSLVPFWLQGQTLGKKLLGLRVVELTGKPLTMMGCFSRYGGYAAGMATGMVGFAQVLWDDNRQAIQDKIAHTVVVDLRAPPRDTVDVAAAVADGQLSANAAPAAEPAPPTPAAVPQETTTPAKTPRQA